MRWLITIFLLLLFSSRPSLAAYSAISNLPTNYQNYGTPSDPIVLPDGEIWYPDSSGFRLVRIDSSGNIKQEVGREGSLPGEFNHPLVSVTRDKYGYLYLLTDCKIYKLDFQGAYKTSFGTCGDGGGLEFSEPQGIAYDSSDNTLYVSDGNHSRIVKLTTTGTYISQFGTAGSGDGQLSAPWGITVDESGNIYVAESNNHRVSVFDTDHNFVRKFGSNSDGDYKMDFPKDVAILSTGEIIVTSQNSQKIKKFTSAGVFISEWGTNGRADGSFIAPEYLTIDADDNILVTDWDVKTIQTFDKNGTFISAIRNHAKTNGRFTNPSDIEIDTAGNIYVLDDGYENARIQKFNSSGVYQSTIVEPGEVGGGVYHFAISPTSGYIYLTSNNEVVIIDLDGEVFNTFGEFGTGDGQFNTARGIAIDSSGNVYVADYYNSRVQKFDSDGNFVLSWGTLGIGDGEFIVPEEIYIDTSDNVYVGSNYDSYVAGELDEEASVQKFDTSGNFISSLPGFGYDSQNYYRINGLYIAADNSVFIADGYQNRIQHYDSSGTHLETIGRLGGGYSQFNNVHALDLNTATGEFWAADQDNHRLQVFDEGVRIHNLIDSADVINIDDSQSLARRALSASTPGIDSLDAQLYFGDYLVSDFMLDLSQDRDWSLVTTLSLPNESKSLIVNLNPTDAPGVSATHSLYLPKRPGQTSVYVCPNATALSDLTTGCSGGYSLNQGDSGLTTITVESVEYWKIEDLAGTGAFAEVAHALEPVVEDEEITTSEQATVTIQALDEEENLATTYQGTVSFTSSPSTNVTLPADYTFTAEDDGAHTFLDSLTFTAAGTYTISVRDTTQNNLLGVFTINVDEVASTQNNTTNNTESSSTSSSSSNSASSSTTPSLTLTNTRYNTGTLNLFKDTIDSLIKPSPLPSVSQITQQLSNLTPSQSYLLAAIIIIVIFIIIILITIRYCKKITHNL